MTHQPLLSIRNLSVHFPGPRGLVRAVENVSWQVDAGRTLAIRPPRSSRTARSCSRGGTC